MEDSSSDENTPLRRMFVEAATERPRTIQDLLLSSSDDDNPPPEQPRMAGREQSRKHPMPHGRCILTMPKKRPATKEASSAQEKTKGSAASKSKKAKCPSFQMGAETTSTMSAVAPQFPDDLWLRVAIYLDAPDILNLVCVNKFLNEQLGKSVRFWKTLNERDAMKSGVPQQATASGTRVSAEAASMEDGNDDSYLTLKESFLVQECIKKLKKVKWIPIDQKSQQPGPYSNCAWYRVVFAKLPQSNVHEAKLVAISPATGLFHVLMEKQGQWQWQEVHQSLPLPTMFGYTLTPLDSWRLVCFGGGSRDEIDDETNVIRVVNHVLLITMSADEQGKISIEWSIIETQNPAPSGRMRHSATLIGGRYLFVVGGENVIQHLLDEAILDTETWTWIDQVISIGSSIGKPRGFLGHSCIWDVARNRLVLLGETRDDSNLNINVWELQVGDKWQADLESSLPWRWNRVHNENSLKDDAGYHAFNCLRPGHVCCMVSRSTAIFTFGGDNSTKNILGYDLEDDLPFLIETEGIIPVPCAYPASAYLERNGYPKPMTMLRKTKLICHGSLLLDFSNSG